jgi:pimeloyl-ACP methyl ester carboxylesterase
MPDTGQTVTLNDGRVLGVAEYGAPDGRPVLYFHGHPGARIEWPVFGDDDCARELGARIIAVDRPGHGLSDFKPRRQIIDWADDIAELADLLGLDRFAILGMSGGGPYALACARAIPDRLTAVVVISGMGPPEAPGSKRGLSWTYAGKGRVSRWFFLKLMALGVRKQLDRFAQQMADAMQGPDKELLHEMPAIVKGTADVFGEALRSGVAGAHYEAGLYSRPWGFKLQDISTRIHLWHGMQDDNVLPSVATHVAGSLPDCQATFLENEGHISLARHGAHDYLGVLVA